MFFPPDCLVNIAYLKLRVYLLSMDLLSMRKLFERILMNLPLFFIKKRCDLHFKSDFLVSFIEGCVF